MRSQIKALTQARSTYNPKTAADLKTIKRERNRFLARCFGETSAKTSSASGASPPAFRTFCQRDRAMFSATVHEQMAPLAKEASVAYTFVFCSAGRSAAASGDNTEAKTNSSARRRDSFTGFRPSAGSSAALLART